MSNLTQSMPKTPLVTFITDVKGDEPEILSKDMARETLKSVSIFDRNRQWFTTLAWGGWVCNYRPRNEIAVLQSSEE